MDLNCCSFFAFVASSFGVTTIIENKFIPQRHQDWGISGTVATNQCPESSLERFCSLGMEQLGIEVEMPWLTANGTNT
jgi:hypothetical protein